MLAMRAGSPGPTFDRIASTKVRHTAMRRVHEPSSVGLRRRDVAVPDGPRSPDGQGVETDDEQVAHASAALEHEIHNALTAISGAAHALQRTDGGLAGHDREALAKARSREAQRLGFLLDADVSEPALVCVIDPVEDAATCARALGTTVLVDVPDDLVAVAPAHRLTQVLHNLLNNARRYAPGPVHIEAARTGDAVVIRVRDHGPGVPVAERHSIFERGVRGSTSVGMPGSGLGLATCAEILRDLGGTISVGSNPSGGARFVLHLPAQPDPVGDVAER